MVLVLPAQRHALGKMPLCKEAAIPRNRGGVALRPAGRLVIVIVGTPGAADEGRGQIRLGVLRRAAAHAPARDRASRAAARIRAAEAERPRGAGRAGRRSVCGPTATARARAA